MPGIRPLAPPGGRALQGWISPEGLQQMYEADIAAADTRLENTPYDLLRAPNGLNLRYYQINAIEAAEKAIIHGARTALLAMATGTGKTRTVLGMIYRFLSTNRFRRILFLVDRNALGEQIVMIDPVTGEVLNAAKLEDEMKFDVDAFNRKVITESFNRTVLQEIYQGSQTNGSAVSAGRIKLTHDAPDERNGTLNQ